MSRGDPGIPALAAGNTACDCYVAAVQRDVVDDLLPVDLLHLAHDRIILPCQKVIDTFIIPKIAFLPKQSEGDKVCGEIGTEATFLRRRIPLAFGLMI